MANSSQFTRMMRLPDAPDYADYADCSGGITGALAPGLVPFSWERPLGTLRDPPKRLFPTQFPIVGGGPPGLPAARSDPRNPRNLRLALAVSPFTRARTAQASCREARGGALAERGAPLETRTHPV